MKKTLTAFIASATLSATPVIADQFSDCAIANYEKTFGRKATPSERFTVDAQSQVMRELILKLSKQERLSIEATLGFITLELARNGSLDDGISQVIMAIKPCAQHI
jgi:hypothetical protein